MFWLIKKSYHQFSLNNLMKIESLEFKLYFDVCFFVGFFGHLCLIFSRCKAFTANNRWPVRPYEINHFLSGNSILFLDFSYLLSIFFLLDDAFASPADVVFFFDSHTKTTI